MHNNVERTFRENLTQSFRVADVRFKQLIIFVGQMRVDIAAFERGRVEVIEIVHDRNAPGFFGEKAFDQMRADKTRAAGD